MCRPTSFALALIAVLSICGRETPAQLNKAFSDHHAAKKLAEAIKEQLNKDAPRSLYVRPIEAPDGAFDAGLAKLIGDELELLGFTIDPRAKTVVSGEISRLPLNPALPPEGFTVECRIKSEIALTGIRFDVAIIVENVNEAASRVEPTGEIALPPVKDLPADRKAEAKPTVAETRMCPHPTSPYAVSIEVLKEKTWEPVVPRLEHGDFVIDLPNGCRFRPVFHNATEYDAWARSTYDGMDRFAFANDPKLRKAVDIVFPKSMTHRSCFFRNEEGGEGFKIGEAYAVAKLQQPDKSVGQIVVTFGAAWEKGKPMPPLEEGIRGVRAKGPLGVDLGPLMVEPVKLIERELGEVRATVRIRYNVK